MFHEGEDNVSPEDLGIDDEQPTDSEREEVLTNPYGEKLLRLAEEHDIYLDTNRKDQHLLVSEEAVLALVESAKLSAQDSVLEVGPGLGQITEELAKRAGRVYAIEIDHQFDPVLAELNAKYPNIQIISGSATEVQWPRVNKFVANPPFSIFEQILRKVILDKEIKAASIVIGERFYKGSVPAERQNSRVGLMTKAFFKGDLVKTLEREDFFPKSREQAVVLSLLRKVKHESDYGLKTLVTRMLRSPNANAGSVVHEAISEAFDPRRVDPERIPSVESFGIPGSVMRKRLQDLTNSDMVVLASALGKISSARYNRGRRERFDD